MRVSLRAAFSLFLLLFTHTSEAQDVSFDTCRITYKHFANPSRDPSTDAPTGAYGRRDQCRPLATDNYRNMDYSEALVEMMAAVNGRPAWSDDVDRIERESLNFLGIDNLCGRGRGGVLYLIFDRRQLPLNVKDADFRTFINALRYIGLSHETTTNRHGDVVTNTGRLARPFDHIGDANAFLLSTFYSIQGDVGQASAIAQRIAEIWVDGGSVLIAVVPNVRNDDAVAELESTTQSAFLNVFTGFGVDGVGHVRFSRQVGNRRIDETTYYKSKSAQLRQNPGSSVTDLNNVMVDYQRLGAKRLWRLWRLFVRP